MEPAGPAPRAASHQSPRRTQSPRFPATGSSAVPRSVTPGTCHGVSRPDNRAPRGSAHTGLPALPGPEGGTCIASVCWTLAVAEAPAPTWAVSTSHSNSGTWARCCKSDGREPEPGGCGGEAPGRWGGTGRLCVFLPILLSCFLLFCKL